MIFLSSVVVEPFVCHACCLFA